MAKRRGKKELAAVEDRVMEILQGEHPQTVRQVYYQLLGGPGGIEKTERAYKNLIKLVLRMRRKGRLPYQWIADESRGILRAMGDKGGIERMFERLASSYDMSLWEDEPVLPIIMCESRGLAGGLRSLARELDVALVPCGGTPSETLVWDLAQLALAEGKAHTLALWLADWDPAGRSIQESTDRKAERFLAAQGYQGEYQSVRLALDPELIERFDLPTHGRKPGEKRYPEMRELAEVEALPAGWLRGMLSENIRGLLPEGKLESLREQSQRERETWSRYFAGRRELRLSGGGESEEDYSGLPAAPSETERLRGEIERLRRVMGCECRVLYWGESTDEYRVMVCRECGNRVQVMRAPID